MRKYIRWGNCSESAARIKRQLAKANEFSVGDAVLAGGLKGNVSEITAIGSVRVRVGGMRRDLPFHPDQVQKQIPLNAKSRT